MNLNHKSIIYLSVILSLFQPFMAAGQILSFQESEISLNGIWRFKYIPSIGIGKDSMFYQNEFRTDEWSEINVPGHWELQGFAEPDYSGVKEGTGLYRRTFELPADYKNRQIFIQFDGVLYGYDVFVNGKFVGSWASSFNAASFNITDYVNFSEENLLAVRVSTRPRGYQFDLSDCWALSGIFREVKLFSTPDTYIKDYSVQTFINSAESSLVKVSVEMSDSISSSDKLQIRGELQSPQGKKFRVTESVKELSGNELLFKVKSPELWTAETPNLYKLKLSLTQDGKVIQEKNQVVGIREISIDNIVLKLNGSPLKLRGVNHHDLVPETGRVMSREQILNDLKLMKDANINYIRTSHYPPDHRLLDLCDSLGLYVSCEVPFNFGSNLLTDTTYQDILLKRAKATLFMNKNHPSIIIWSIGNENELTPIVAETGKYVQQADPSRPVCFPQKGSYFRANYTTFPDFLDIYTPHYCGDWWIKEFAKTTTKPVILTEYSHARGLTFADFEVTWKELFRNRQFAGGAVWHFHDQGILRKASDPVNRYQPAYCVWKDSLNYYDSNGGSGTDGIVYSDRTPQVDYWEVRKVYSPVQIIEEQLPVVAGKQTIQFSVYNQFDFSNLDILHGKWSLYKNREVFQTGNITVNCAPHDTVVCNLSVHLPYYPETDVWYLKIDFTDKNQRAVYEHTIELNVDNADNVNNEILDQLKKSPLEMNTENGISKIESNGTVYEFSKNDLSLNLSGKDNGPSLVVGGAYARVGRGLVINDLRAKDKSKFTSWDPHLISASKVENLKETSTLDSYNLSANSTYLRGDDYPGEQLDGNISYLLTNERILTVSYSLKPDNVTGIIMEAGISFILSKQITDFMWVGRGPYSSYPGKEMLSDFGIHYLKKGDLYFHGNRSNVNLAVLSDSKGNGVAIISDRSNIAVEVEDDQIVVSHLGFVTGKNTKVPATDISEVKGEFKIIVLHAGHWPEKILELVGSPDPKKRPFQPFYHSYEQSR